MRCDGSTDLAVCETSKGFYWIRFNRFFPCPCERKRNLRRWAHVLMHFCVEEKLGWSEKNRISLISFRNGKFWMRMRSEWLNGWMRSSSKIAHFICDNWCLWKIHWRQHKPLHADSTVFSHMTVASSSMSMPSISYLLFVLNGSPVEIYHLDWIQLR